MIRYLLSLYRPGFAKTVVYMLQSTEYQAGHYLRWLWRTKDFSEVMQRRALELTGPAKLLLFTLYVGIALQVMLALGMIYLGIEGTLAGGVFFGLALLITYPLLWAHLMVVPLILGRLLISRPAQQRAIKNSAGSFARHNGIKIAVAGSYGKTTMKELLNTVLGQGLKVAATPANKNVSISHAQFAKSLKGSEEVLIIEYGEGAPGDVRRFAEVTKPTHAIITGLAPAHLDRYKTLQAAGEDIFSVADYLQGKNIYVNREASASQPFLKDTYELFDAKEALGWQVSDIEVSLTGTSFKMKKGKKSLELHSGLVGRHQVGFLAFVAAFGLQLGLTEKQVKAGIAATSPFEHRMQPYQLGGAWIVDDTYNGNLEGIKAGTGLLKELKAKRKIYVTPGLVDQGQESQRVHTEMGRLIAVAKPNIVVLMKNSVTAYIQRGLKETGFKGELRLEDNPPEFYTNLAHFVAAGDLVVMQNDWTDNYS